MSILWSLSVRHLRLNRRRTAITVIGIVLSVSVITAISGFIVSFQDLLYRDAVLRDGLWHVRYAGLSAETAEAVAAEPVFSDFIREEREDGVTLSLLFEKLSRKSFDDAEAVCRRHGADPNRLTYNNNLLIAKGLLPGNYYRALYSFAAVLLLLVGAASVLVISNAFSISAAERGRQFGLLKSAGATKGQIRGLVLLEGMALAAVAIPLGLLGGLAAEWVALTIANSILGSMSAVNLLVDFRVRVSFWMLAAAVAAALITILLAAWFPAAKAARVSPVDAIRQTQAVKIRPRSLRIPAFVGRRFGMEGVLAAKTMARNRGRYRTTVLSLVVSVVLFIGVDSFGRMLVKATGMMYQDYGSNVLIQLRGEDRALQEDAAAELSGWEGVAATSHRELTGTVDLPAEMITQAAAENLGAGWGTRRATLYSQSDEAFDALCKALGQDPAEYRDAENPRVILINATGTYIREGRRMTFVPYRIRTGTVIPVMIGDGEVSLTIGGEVAEIPSGIKVYYAANGLNLVAPESVRAALQPENHPDELSLALFADDPDGFERRAEEYLTARMGEEDYALINFESMAENSRNIGLLVMIFVYGFIAMLSLIGVTNVVTTISTGVALRRREFAMLRSVGMTQGGVRKILGFESLIYGVRSLAWGIPLGFLACLLMYRSLGLVMDFGFIWPVASMLISVAAVLLLCFCTTMYAGQKQRKNNIVAALQEEIS